MFRTIQVPQASIASPLTRALSLARSAWGAWQQHREVVQHLRKLDGHLTRDIDLDREALWRPRPEIRRLQSHLFVAAGCHEERY